MPLLNVGLFGCFAQGIERYSLRVLNVGTGVDSIRAVGLGYQHAVMLSRRGDCALTFGNPEAFRLGFEFTPKTSASRTTPYELILPSDPARLPWTDVACGQDFTIIYRSRGTHMVSFGRNTFGQLGHGAASPVEPMRLVELPPEMAHPARGGLRKIVAGGGHVVALMHDGSVFAWGCDTKGQVGGEAHAADEAVATAATKANPFGASSFKPVRLTFGGILCGGADILTQSRSGVKAGVGGVVAPDALGGSGAIVYDDAVGVSMEALAKQNKTQLGHEYSTLSGVLDAGLSVGTDGLARAMSIASEKGRSGGEKLGPEGRLRTPTGGGERTTPAAAAAARQAAAASSDGGRYAQSRDLEGGEFSSAASNSRDSGRGGDSAARSVSGGPRSAYDTAAVSEELSAGEASARAAPFEWAVDISAGPSSTAIVTSRGRVLVLGDDLAITPAPLYTFSPVHLSLPFTPPDAAEAVTLGAEVAPPSLAAARRPRETPESFRERMLALTQRDVAGGGAGSVTAGLRAFSGAVAVGDRGGFCVSHTAPSVVEGGISPHQLAKALADPRNLTTAPRGRMYVWGADKAGGAVGTPGGSGTKEHRALNSIPALAAAAVGCVVTPEVLSHVAMGGTRGYFASEAYFYAVAPGGGITPVAAAPVSSLSAGYDAAAVVLDPRLFQMQYEAGDGGGVDSSSSLHEVGGSLPVSPRSMKGTPLTGQMEESSQGSERKLRPEVLDLGVALPAV